MPNMSLPGGTAASGGFPNAGGGFAMPQPGTSFAPANGVAQVPAKRPDLQACPEQFVDRVISTGSTSRSTGYNFTPQNAAPASNAPGFSNVPYTANGSGNPATPPS